MDDLCCRVTVRRPVHLVLHCGEELLRHLCVRRIVHTGRVDIEDLPGTRSSAPLPIGGTARPGGCARGDRRLGWLQAGSVRARARPPGALQSNCSEFPNSCPWGQFTLGPNALEVFVHGRHCDLKQLGNLGLGQPDGLVFEAALDARPPVLGLVKDHLSPRQRIAGHAGTSSPTGVTSRVRPHASGDRRITALDSEGQPSGCVF